MQVRGTLAKMRTALGDPIAYSLHLGDEVVSLNALLGEEISLVFTGARYCRVCGKRVRTLYGEGFCWPDFERDAANSPCIVRPELCEAHLGGGRDPAWEARYHHQPHAVYVADSGGLKVGVTGADNTVPRWIDQGASAGARIAVVPYRRLAGDIEVALKATLSDRTAWQRMLAADACDLDALREAQAGAIASIPSELAEHARVDEPIVALKYPMLSRPTKVRGVDLGKAPTARGRLVGIRGQYLVFGDGAALNVRRHTGFQVTLDA